MSRLDYAHVRAEMSTGIPRGVGAPPPPGMDPKRGKLMCIKVRMLDDSVAVFHLGHKALGQTLLDEVSRHLNLLETDYFGLEFIDNMRNRCWLDKDKPIVRQIANSDAKFYFVVKFYSPNPIDLEEEYTRYLLTLQIRRDLAMGDLQCSESTAALLAAYLVQSDCGDFSADDYPDATYLSHTRFIPNQTYDFQQKVMENHRNLIGMSPGESDLALLEVARRCDFYGIKFHAAKDIEGTEANLSVMHLGIKVFHQLHCVSTFSWAKIRKLSFKRKKLLIKLHPDSYQYYKETIEFVFDTRNECKNFWKKCVEHHAFFRCTAVENGKKDGRLFSKGSSFRYNGRTQKQLIDYVREHHKRREPFTRPLRSAGTISSNRRNYPSSNSVQYSMIRDKKQSGNPRHDHRSMPHLASSQNNSDYANYKKKEIIYGVNSTFSTESIALTEPISRSQINPSNNNNTVRFGLSTSLTSNVDNSNPNLYRADSSDSGGLSLHTDYKSMNNINNILINNNNNDITSSIHSAKAFNIPDPFESRLDPETMSEKSDSYLEREDSLVGQRTFMKPSISIMDIAKDFLNIERSSANDLRILSQTLFSKLEPLLNKCKVLSELFTVLTELYTSQKELLDDLENLINSNDQELEEFPRKVLCVVHNIIPMYTSLLQQYPIYISALDELCRSQMAFRLEMMKVESSEDCYISINWILLRIIHRIVFWQPILARLVEQQLTDGKEEKEMASARVALEKSSVFSEKTRNQRESLTEYVALLQIEKDLGSPGLLSHPSRRLLRIGFVERWAQKGLTARILVLCSDRLLVGHRSSGADNPFAIQGEIKLKGMLVEDGDTYNVTGRQHDVITVHSGDKSVVFTSTCKDEWLDDMCTAVKTAAKCRLELPQLQLEKKEELDSDYMSRSKNETDSKSGPSPLQVCWYRKSTLGILDIYKIVSNTQAGYLLRKLRNSTGWQRLWVVLASHTLFFYKNHQEDKPLANLPLIDYGFGLPSMEDMMHHDYCFKLYYGSHKYFFRTDSSYSFQKWTDAIRSCAINKKQLDRITALSLHI